MLEQSLAIALVLAVGMVCGAVLLALLNASDEPALVPGAVLGAVIGGAMVLVEQDLNRLTSPGAFVSGMWVVGTWAGWGAAFGWTCDRVRRNERDGVMAGGPRVLVESRRRFLVRLGGVSAALTAVPAACSALLSRRGDSGGPRWSATHPLPNAGSSPLPAPGTRPEFTPLERHYRIDTVTRPPALNGDRWRLQVRGLVERPLEMTLSDLRSREPLHQFITLACISNPVGGDLVSTTRWTGVSLQRLLPEWRLASSASHLKMISADGFAEVVPLDTIAADVRVMLAYAWDGTPLPVEHGFPLRLYVPDRYGMKQPKWIVAVEALDHWEAGYWVARGWDREGRVRSSAAIDTIAVDARVADDRGRLLTPVGGMAYAGARGVSKVEVQVDGGAWRQAATRPPLSDTTWVIWRADLELGVGDHAVAVRGYEGDGSPQGSDPQIKHVRI
jgi:DMSO/TMAO reductase YedYZ molybdopterin-dependent catalytic subunit